MGQVIAVISGKGGTGKTTLSAGLAACLAAEGCRVLAVDLDVGLRNLDISLGLAQSAPLSFDELLSGAYRLEQVAPHPEIPNLYLLTAPVNDTPEEIDAAAFFALLDEVRQLFDFCILDAPAGVGAGFYLAAHRADRVIVVANADPASLRDGACVAGRLPEEVPAKLVVNRVSPRAYRRMKMTVDDITGRRWPAAFGAGAGRFSCNTGCGQGQTACFGDETRCRRSVFTYCAPPAGAEDAPDAVLNAAQRMLWLSRRDIA